ncbi:MAG: hypothetical protein DRI70_06815, partial [Bacteroidetes bacterium]
MPLDRQIDIWIAEAEEIWLEKIHTHIKNLFSTVFLPSHDQTHHRRVWNIARSLLKEMALYDAMLDRSLVEGLLIATYFHDVGMVRSAREDHGALGREICESYFNEKGVIPFSRYSEALEAIELHDVKNMELSVSKTSRVPLSILDILSVADDLEALGTIGIYRYIEIYLMRDSNLRNLGIRILGNANKRFENLRIRCKDYPGLLTSYEAQFSDLVSFFDNYNQQLLTEKKPESVYFGHLGVVNHIRTFSLEKHTMPMDLL